MKTNYLDYEGLQYGAMHYRGVVAELPENPAKDEVYKYNGQFYLYDGSAWVTSASSEGFRYDASFDSIAEGIDSTKGTLPVASGGRSHAEGIGTIASGEASHAEGYNTESSGDYSHAEGLAQNSNVSQDLVEFYEFYKTGIAVDTAVGAISNQSGPGGISEVLLKNQGISWTDSNNVSQHADIQDATFMDGSYIIVVENSDFVDYINYTEQQGIPTTVYAYFASTAAGGIGSHVEGLNASAYGACAHAEGFCTVAIGDYSHAEGCDTISRNHYEHSEGKYNVSNDTRWNGSIPSGFVDLGLPSHTLWAEYNVGVDPTQLSSTTDWYGKYIQWGENDPSRSVTSWSWSDYLWGTQINLTKYNATDGLTSLEPEDDMVTIEVGSDYCMPTRKQLGELINECTITWETDYQGVSGLNGMTITGPNGNSIFIPASGNYQSNTLYGAGSACYLWSKEIVDISPSQAYRLFMSSSASETSTLDRPCGLPTRAVMNVEDYDSYTIHSIGIGSSIARENAVEVLSDGKVFVKDLGEYDGTNVREAQSIQDTLSVMQSDINSSVKSSFIANIWKGTQVEYDAIVTKDNNTLYIIV